MTDHRPQAAGGRPPRTPGIRPNLEPLEGRTAPAVFGQPWMEAGRLTVSFAPDRTTVVGSQGSSLFSTLEAQSRLPRAVWQREVLRAFQSWAIHANLNIAVTPDGGQPFGTPGPTQGDPRFGDVRVGAQPMSREALAISVPPDVFLSGTWAGDLLLNSSPGVLNAGNLFPVVEHEVGHVLGLPNSTDPRSPMFGRLTGAKPLTPSDLAALRGLYGARLPDAWEGLTGNERPATATRIRPPDNGLPFNGTSPLLQFGDIGSLRDVDTYLLPPLAGYAGSVTIRVQSAGVSLLAPAVTVFDALGRVVLRGAAASPTGNALFLTLPRPQLGMPYFIRVTGATKDVFGLGRYALAVTYDRRLTTTPAALATLIRQSPSALAKVDDDDAFHHLDESLLDPDHGVDDNPLEAERLPPLVSLTSPSFSATGSVENAGDVDYFRIRSPQRRDDQPVALMARVARSRLNGAFPHVELLDRDEHVIDAEVVVNGNGMFTLEAEGLEPNRDYYVRVTARDGETGNYSFVARFDDAVVKPRTFVAGSRAVGSQPASYHLFVGQSQLFQFTLSAAALPQTTRAAGSVRLDLRDGRNNLVATLRAGALDALTLPALFLAPGSYTAAVTLEPPPAGTPTGLEFRLTGVNLSDPIGPTLTNPLLTPQFTAPGDPTSFLYPGDVVWKDPYFWVLIDPNGYLVIPGSNGATHKGFALQDGQPLPSRP